MLQVTLYSTESIFDRPGNGDTEVLYSLTLMSTLRRQKLWLSCFLQRRISVLMAVTRCEDLTSVDDVAKVKSASTAFRVHLLRYNI